MVKIKVDATEKITEFIVPCACGCGIIRFERCIDKYGDILSIIHYVTSTEANHVGLWQVIKKRCKMAFCALLGKDYVLYDVVLTSTEDIEKFKKLVSEV